MGWELNGCSGDPSLRCPGIWAGGTEAKRAEAGVVRFFRSGDFVVDGSVDDDGGMALVIAHQCDNGALTSWREGSAFAARTA